MVVSFAANKTAVNKLRPAGTSVEVVPLNVIPENNAAVAAPSAAADGSAPGTDGRAPGRRLGEILVDLGYVTQGQIEQVLQSKEDAYARLGQRLLHRGVINEAQLAYAMSVRLGIPFTELT